MHRDSLPLLLLLMLTLVCQGAVTRIHLRVSPPGVETLLHPNGQHSAGNKATHEHDNIPCHGCEHYCQGECGHCRILISPTSLVHSQNAQMVTHDVPPLAPPLMYVGNFVPEQALRPPIG